MTQHETMGRTDKELLWFQRRNFLQAAAAWAALGGAATAHAQSRSNIVEIVGDAMLNGVRLTAQQTIQTGDSIATGPGSTVMVDGKPMMLAGSASGDGVTPTMAMDGNGQEYSDQTIDIAKIEGQVKASSVRKVSEFIEKHPEESVSILRSWLHEG